MRPHSPSVVPRTAAGLSRADYPVARRRSICLSITRRYSVEIAQRHQFFPSVGSPHHSCFFQY